MKKLIILLALTSTTAFAQTNFLTESEAVKINDYLDDICPDTYCGGDIVFYTHGITCKGNSCTIEMSGQGYSEFDKAATSAAVGTSVVTSEYKDVVVNFEELEIGRDEEDEYDTLQASFSCTLKNLPMEMTDYDQKEEMFYDKLVWGCVRELEATVYSWQ